MKRILSILFFIAVSIVALQAHESHIHSTKYKIRRVSPDGGLGANGQRDVRQDKWGFMWVATVNDLYRFDGYAFKHYTRKINKLESPISLSFERLEVDRNGDFYITSNYGLLKYNSLTDNFDLLFPEGTSLVKEDSKERLWISTQKSVGLFDRESHKFLHVGSDTGLISDASAVCTKVETVYVGTSTGEVYVYDESKGVFNLIFHDPQYNIVDISRADSLIYVLTERSGLLVLSAGDHKEVKKYDFFYPAGDSRVSARALIIDKYGHVWISGQRGLYMLEPESGKYVHYYYDKTDPYGLPSSSAWRISEDSYGNLWFGTYSGGLCFINLDEQEKLESFNGFTDGLSYSVVSSFAEDGKYLWIGTEGWGLNRYDKTADSFTLFKHVHDKNSLSYDNIMSLLYTGNNELWIGTSRGGMDCMDTKTGQFLHYTVSNNMLLNDHVERIVAEADSGLWIKYLMDRDNISYLSFKDNKTFHYNFLNQPILSNGNISDICRGSGDTLWIASSYQLLIMDVNSKKVSLADYKHSEVAKIQNINIRTIYTDKKRQVVWIGSVGDGLLMYDISTGVLHRKADLSKYGVYSIYSLNIDDDDNIWMGTNNGLFCLDAKTNNIQQFGKADGAQGNTYYPFSTFKSKSGQLYFGGNEGFTVIDTVEKTYNVHKPQVIFSDFLLDNTSVFPMTEGSLLSSSVFRAKEITLDYNRNDFTIEFASTNYLNPDKNHFKYRLRGYDERWIETDANYRSASYAKVPQGRYNFEIMTANNDGVWGELSSIQIIVKPAPWLSAWAIMLYLILFAVIMYMIVRYYNYRRRLKMQYYLDQQEEKRKEEYHQEQLKFFTNVSHDFRTPLSLILTALESVKSGSNISKYISILEHNAGRLLALINELMDFRSLQNRKVKLSLRSGNWNKFVTDCCYDFNEYAGRKGIDFATEFDPEMSEELFFDPKAMEKNILNLLNNAFKYTPEGKIKVCTMSDIGLFNSSYSNNIVVNTSGYSGKMFGLVISDSGVGISGDSIGLVFERYYRVDAPDSSRHIGSGIGLALVKSLVELHKGYIAIYSDRGTGSDIVIGFPCDYSVYNDEDFDAGNSNLYLSETPIISDVKQFSDEESVPDKLNLVINNKKTILLVEDNDDLRELLAGLLGEYYEVKEAANGVEALKQIREEDAELIITDVMMPDMNGIELTKAIKEDIGTSHIPVIMLTAKTGAENQIEGLQSGADAYLEKPVNKKILMLTLSNIFDRQIRLKDFYAKHYFANTDNNTAQGSKRDTEFMKQLIELIEKRLSDVEIDVLQIASSLAMSRRTLYGKVKALTGQSVVEFIRNYRLRKAAQMLMEEDVQISEVMVRVGIDNASYFSRVFRKEFGMSPSEFALNIKKTNIE